MSRRSSVARRSTRSRRSASASLRASSTLVIGMGEMLTGRPAGPRQRQAGEPPCASRAARISRFTRWLRHIDSWYSGGTGASASSSRRSSLPALSPSSRSTAPRLWSATASPARSSISRQSAIGRSARPPDATCRCPPRPRSGRRCRRPPSPARRARARARAWPPSQEETPAAGCPQGSPPGLRESPKWTKRLPGNG